MRQFNQKLLRMIYTLLLAMLLTGAALAAGTEASDLRVWPQEESGGTVQDAAAGQNTLRRAAGSTALTTSDSMVENITRHEGFIAEPVGGFIVNGCMYSMADELFGEDCAPITEKQGEELLRYALSGIEPYLNSFFAQNGIQLNQNQFDALVSFTYNVGIGWTTYKNEDGTWCKLKVMLLEGPSAWTEERVQESFGTWVKAGGQVLPGLVRRRAEEAALFCTPYTAPEPEPEPEPVPVPDPVPGGVFTDVPSNQWYAPWVLSAYQKGFMKGVGGSRFAPEQDMTRAELVMAMANFAGVDLSRYGAVRFTDVPAGQWYTAAVDWATQMGLINGMGDGTFRPDEPIRRDHACNILARYLRGRSVAAGPAVSQFRDHSQIPNDARDNVYYCASLGLINGMEYNDFRPGENMTRGQMAKILVCMDQLFG